jgi:hypothetical protein
MKRGLLCIRKQGERISFGCMLHTIWASIAQLKAMIYMARKPIVCIYTLPNLGFIIRIQMSGWSSIALLNFSFLAPANRRIL